MGSNASFLGFVLYCLLADLVFLPHEKAVWGLFLFLGFFWAIPKFSLKCSFGWLLLPFCLMVFFSSLLLSILCMLRSSW